MNSKTSSKERVIPISISNVNDQVAAFLYATKALKNNEYISNINLGEIKDGLVQVKIKTKKEVESKSYNGKKSPKLS